MYDSYGRGRPIPKSPWSQKRLHCIRKWAYLKNRIIPEFDPLNSYEEDVRCWALINKENLKEHCEKLLEALANPQMLKAAWCQICPEPLAWSKQSNTFWDDVGSWSYLQGLAGVLKKGIFDVGDYKKVKIPKFGKPGTRTIEVPPIDTRVVARSVVNVLTPILDPMFLPMNIGFRPKKTIYDGLAAAEAFVKQGRTHLVSCDIRDAFGQLPRKRCFQILRSKLYNSSVVNLIEALSIKTRKKGVPQGVATSPLLLNIYLDHLLDSWWKSKFPTDPLIRYADDLAVFCKNRTTATNLFAALKKQITTIGFELKESESTAVFDLNSGKAVEWLGFKLQFQDQRLEISISNSSWLKLDYAFADTRRFLDTKIEVETENQAIAIATGWLSQKSVGIEKDQLYSETDKIRELAAKHDFSLSDFTDEWADEIWATAHETWQKARRNIGDWVAGAYPYLDAGQEPSIERITFRFKA